MKNLCRKGKVHPSPAASSSSSAAGCSHRDAYTVLKLLPVAIATLSAALPPDDQEVLAYLVARSPDVLPLQETETRKSRRAPPGRKHSAKPPTLDSDEDSSCSPRRVNDRATSSAFGDADALLHRFPAGRFAADKRKASQPLRTHRPSFDCACFQCYTSYWSRWDASPNRQTIHEAIDLFEDHMAAVAAAATEAAAKHRGRSRKGSRPGKEEKLLNPLPWPADNKPRDDLKVAAFVAEEGAEGREPTVAVFAPEDSKPAPKSKQIVPVAFDDVARPSKKIPEQQQQQEAKAGAAFPLGGRSLVRRMFPDIMGFVADHLWTAWSSPIRTANF